MAKNMKAQAAMEYLMTYGWAILIVIIVAAALWALGIFNPNTWTQGGATGFAGFQVSDWRVNSTGTIIVLKSLTANANITQIDAVYGSTTWTAFGGFNATVIAPNSEKLIYIPGNPDGFVPGAGGPAVGGSYSVRVTITYNDLSSQIGGSLKSTGTLSGTAVA
jgi:hypothetical protein